MRGRGAAVGVSLAVLVAGCVLLPLLGHRPLTDWDEGIYAEVSREMLGGGWLTPMWNGQVWLEKPPLMLWVTAVFFKVFGVGEFWARAGSAIAGMGVVGVLHGWMRRRMGHAEAWMGTGILLSCFGFQHVCRAGEMDALLTLGCVVAVCGLAGVEEGRPGGWTIFWGGFAVAAMTKGAASVVLPLTVVVLALGGRSGRERWGRHCFGRKFWIGFGGFVAVVAPWHVAMWMRYGRRFVEEYAGYHALGRALHAIEGHRTHGWFYLWVVLVSAPPFAAIFPWGAWTARRGAGRVWTVFGLVVFVFYSVARTRLPHYIAPVYPAIAAVTAPVVVGWLRAARGRFAGSCRQFPALAAVALLLVYGVSAAVTDSARRRLHAVEPGVGVRRTDERETIGLLRGAFGGEQRMAGPLLVWRDGPPMSIATCVFYAGRPAVQVTVDPAALASGVGDRYEGASATLDQGVAQGPRLIVADRALLGRLPGTLSLTTMASSENLVLGIVRRRE